MLSRLAGSECCEGETYFVCRSASWRNRLKLRRGGVSCLQCLRHPAHERAQATEKECLVGTLLQSSSVRNNLRQNKAPRCVPVKSLPCGAAPTATRRPFGAQQGVLWSVCIEKDSSCRRYRALDGMLATATRCCGGFIVVYVAVALLELLSSVGWTLIPSPSRFGKSELGNSQLRDHYLPSAIVL